MQGNWRGNRQKRHSLNQSLSEPPSELALLTQGPLLPPSILPYLTQQGLELPPNFSFEEWQTIGPRLATAYDKIPILFGQWLAFGEDRYPDRYAQAVLLTGLSCKTLYNAASVSRKLQGRFRDTKDICYSTQAATASLPPEASERVMDWAIESGATVRDVQRKVAEIKGTVLALTEETVSPCAEVTLFASAASFSEAGIAFLTFEQRDEVMRSWLELKERAGLSSDL